MKQCSACNRQHDSAFKRCDECREWGRKNAKRWYNKNKESELKRVEEWKNEKTICECGVEVRKGYLSKHRKTQKHQDTINAVDC